jgi:N-hydroxyarylamine O-acetyltransferase
MLDLDAYFRRIAYRGERAPTLNTLRALQAQHLLAIAFENLDVSHVLRALGFEVTALSARVVWERPAEMLRARTHMLLLVDLHGERFLCDVGFGGLTPTAPLRLVPGTEQATSHETFRVLDEAPEFVVQARVGGIWKALYRFDLQAQQQVDIEVLNFYVAQHADSPMLGRLLAARVAPDRRFALRNGTFTIYHLDGRQEQRQLATVAELRDVLGGTFGVAVPADAGLDAALRALLA